MAHWHILMESQNLYSRYQTYAEGSYILASPHRDITYYQSITSKIKIITTPAHETGVCAV